MSTEASPVTPFRAGRQQATAPQAVAPEITFSGDYVLLADISASYPVSQLWRFLSSQPALALTLFSSRPASVTARIAQAATLVRVLIRSALAASFQAKGSPHRVDGTLRKFPRPAGPEVVSLLTIALARPA